MKLAIQLVDVTKYPGTTPVRMEAVVEAATGDVLIFYEIDDEGRITPHSFDSVYEHRPIDPA